MGDPLRRAIGAKPPSEVWLQYRVRHARQLQGWALRAGSRPAEVGGGEPKVRSQGGDSSLSLRHSIARK